MTAPSQTPSTRLRHPSLDEGAGKRCSECASIHHYKEYASIHHTKNVPPSIIQRVCYSSRPKALSRFQSNRVQLYESRGGRPRLPVPNSPCSFCGRKATLNHCSQMKQPTVIFGGGETDALIRTCIFCDLQCMVTTATADRQRLAFRFGLIGTAT